MKKNRLLVLLLMGLFFSWWLEAQDRFPKPEFESNYQTPNYTTPIARSDVMIYLDAAILGLLMVAIAYFTFVRRLRLGIIAVSVCSVVWLGFIKHGCVCPIGAIQNIALTIAHPSYAIPIILWIIFLLPLLSSLWFGRLFCGGVCPLGAIQDLVLIRPTSLPRWLSTILQLFPYLYLGLAVLMAATGSAFLICRYDPFVNLFRWGGTWPLLLWGIAMLLIATCIARPYCRFLCPYGVLLGWFSALSWRHLEIAMPQCVECHLCRKACPMDAIEKPHSGIPLHPKKATARMAILLIMAVPIIILVAWGTSQLAKPLSYIHPTVALAASLQKLNHDAISTDKKVATDVKTINTTSPTTPTIDTTAQLEIQAFLAGGQTTEALYEQAHNIQQEFYYGCWLLGIFWGIVIMAKLIQTARYNHRLLYQVSRIHCLNCGRCFSFCPTQPQIRATL